MKTYLTIFLVAALAWGGCSTAYRNAQTPDAVYYSPEEERTAYTSSNNEQTVIQRDNPDAGSYVVYDNGDNDYADYYEDGYYSRRINMFDRPGGLYAFNNFYWNDPFMWSGLSSWNMGWYYPLAYPSLSLSWTWGSPWGRWHRPWHWGHYSPWYSYGYNPYYTNYGYWGGYGKNITLNPRPATSYGPRQSVSSRAVSGVSNGASTSRVSENAPRRVFRSGNTSDNNVEHTTRRPRRVFKAQPDEHPVRVDNNTRTVETQRPARRVFRSNSNNNRSYRPAQQNTRRSVNRPTRSFNSTPTRSSSRSFSAPARVSAPRGRR